MSVSRDLRPELIAAEDESRLSEVALSTSSTSESPEDAKGSVKRLIQANFEIPPRPTDAPLEREEPRSARSEI